MKLNIDLEKNIINKDNINSICNTYLKYGVTYMKETNNENDFIDYYLTKDVVTLKGEEINELLNKINILNSVILKKLVFHIMKNDISTLEKMKMSKKVIEVMQYCFKRQNIESYKDLNLSFFGRYDLLINTDGKVKIVEINSETPAGMPESFTTVDAISYKVRFPVNEFQYMDINGGAEENLLQSLNKKYKEIINKLENGKKEITICSVFGTEIGEEKGNINWDAEDAINAKHMAGSLHYHLKKDYPNIDIRVVPVDNLQIRKDGVYTMKSEKGTFEKVDYIWSFYPLEWLFTDSGGEDFWNLFMSGKIDLLNTPLNLITQNKAIWAYLYEQVCRNDNIFTDNEISIIHELIPHSSFEKLDGYIKKPLFYREGVGIGDDNYQGDSVYQEFIEQKPFIVDTFYGKDKNKVAYGSGEGLQKGYFTLGIYFGENEGGFIGMYNRFCEKYITDDSSYFTPIYAKIDKKVD